MSASFRVDATGFRDVTGRFTSESELVRVYQREAATELGDTIVRTAAQLSPVGRYPFGRPDTAGPRFSESWRSRWEETDDGGQLVVENADPKANLIIRPTSPHLISARPGHMLRFGTPEEPVFRRVVHHPGTKGNDVPGKLAAAVREPAISALQRVSVRAAASLHDALES